MSLPPRAFMHAMTLLPDPGRIPGVSQYQRCRILKLLDDARIREHNAGIAAWKEARANGTAPPIDERRMTRAQMRRAAGKLAMRT